jgi:hypothetical protein
VTWIIVDAGMPCEIVQNGRRTIAGHRSAGDDIGGRTRPAVSQPDVRQEGGNDGRSLDRTRYCDTGEYSARPLCTGGGNAQSHSLIGRSPCGAGSLHPPDENARPTTR